MKLYHAFGMISDGSSAIPDSSLITAPVELRVGVRPFASCGLIVYRLAGHQRGTRRREAPPVSESGSAAVPEWLPTTTRTAVAQCRSNVEVRASKGPLVIFWAPLFRSRIVGRGFDTLQFKAQQLRHMLRRKSRAAWKTRIDLVLSCPDNAAIKRVSAAGEVRHSVITMHNGVRILLGSYYGAPMAELLARNKGVHEPQEEIAFDEVLKVMKPGASMIELGAYWGYYSLSFAQAVQGARCILVEPSADNLRYGQNNFALNGYEAKFVHGRHWQQRGTARSCTLRPPPSISFVPNTASKSWTCFTQTSREQKSKCLRAQIECCPGSASVSYSYPRTATTCMRP